MLFCILQCKHAEKSKSRNTHPWQRLKTPPTWHREPEKQTKNNKNICNFWPNENVTWQIAAGRICVHIWAK